MSRGIFLLRGLNHRHTCAVHKRQIFKRGRIDLHHLSHWNLLEGRRLRVLPSGLPATDGGDLQRNTLANFHGDANIHSVGLPNGFPNPICHRHGDAHGHPHHLLQRSAGDGDCNRHH